MILFLGLLDLISAGLLAGTAYHLTLPQGLIIGFACYLILKSILFLMDIGSLFDIVGGILLILSLFIALPAPLLFLSAALVGFKGVMTLFAH